MNAQADTLPSPDRQGAQHATVRYIIPEVRAALKIFVLVVCVVLAGSLINHWVWLHEENALISSLGQMVNVDGHRMHVFTEGDGGAPWPRDFIGRGLDRWDK